MLGKRAHLYLRVYLSFKKMINLAGYLYGNIIFNDESYVKFFNVYIESSMCLLIMKALVIANDCRVFKHNSAFRNICANYNTLSTVVEGIYWIVNILFYALLRKLVFVNDGLRSTCIPTDRKKVKTWLLYHQGCLGTCILFFYGLLVTDPSANIYNLIYCAITSIGIITESKFVKKFNKEFEILAEHRHTQTSNI